MQLVHLLLPSLATIALGSALLMPHRERRAPRFVRFRRAPACDAGAVEQRDVPAPSVTSPEGAVHESARVSESLRPTFGQLVENYSALEERATNPSEQLEREPESGSDSVDVLKCDRSAARVSVDDDTLERRDVNSLDDRRALPAEPAKVSTLCATAPAVVAAAERDRVVPLTRRRLRKEIRTVSWPAMLDPSKTACGPEERAQLLRSLGNLAANELSEQLLLAAVSEEDGELRLLALRFLVRAPSAAAGDALAELLVRGSDAERSLAIDGLQRAGRRDDLAAAFGDRIDAIAAKAVFGYVGSRRRADYDQVFEKRLDPSQRDRIAALLAGALE